jgi:hypothetical protein
MGHSWHGNSEMPHDGHFRPLLTPLWKIARRLDNALPHGRRRPVRGGTTDLTITYGGAARNGGAHLRRQCARIAFGPTSCEISGTPLEDLVPSRPLINAGEDLRTEGQLAENGVVAN